MKNKIKMMLAYSGLIISIILLTFSSYLYENKCVNELYGTFLMAISIILMFVAICFAAKIEYETGVFQCRKCGHLFKPTFKAYIFGAHTLMTRHLKCPHCDEKTWCKRKSEKL